MITKNRVQSRDLTIGIVGLGYVGLPTALGFHDAGFNVIGLDVSERVINCLKNGRNPGDDPAFDHSCLLYTSPSPRDLSTSRMPSSA